MYNFDIAKCIEATGILKIGQGNKKESKEFCTPAALGVRLQNI